MRNLEDPGQKIHDFRGAVDYIANRKEFAAARISKLRSKPEVHNVSAAPFDFFMIAKKR